MSYWSEVKSQHMFAVQWIECENSCIDRVIKDTLSS